MVGGCTVCLWSGAGQQSGHQRAAEVCDGECSWCLGLGAGHSYRQGLSCPTIKTHTGKWAVPSKAAQIHPQPCTQANTHPGVNKATHTHKGTNNSEPGSRFLLRQKISSCLCKQIMKWCCPRVCNIFFMILEATIVKIFFYHMKNAWHYVWTSYCNLVMGNGQNDFFFYISLCFRSEHMKQNCHTKS